MLERENGATWKGATWKECWHCRACVIDCPVSAIEIRYPLPIMMNTFPNHSKINSFVACGIVLAGMVSNISLPFKAVAISIMGLFEQYSGVTMTFLEYLLYVTSYQVVLFILFPLIGRYILRIDFSVFTAAQIEKKKMDNRQKAGMISLLVMFLGFVLTSMDVPLFPELGLGGVGLLIVIFMLMYQVEGKPVLNMGEVAAKFDWGLFLMMAFIDFVGRPEVGLVATVKMFLSGPLTALSPVVLVVIAIFATVIVSNGLNNWPVVIIFVSILGVVVETVSGINTAAAILAIAVAGYLAFATPAANPGSAIVYGYQDLIKPSTHIKVAAIISMVLAAVTAFIYYPLLSMII